MEEGRMTTDQKGHVAKRQAGAPVPSVGKDIKLPGGNSISQGRLPILTMAPPNGLKAMGGSNWPEFNDVLLKSTVATLSNTDPDAVPQRVAAVSAALAAFRPVNEIEGMIASQCVALHFAAMECLHRSVLSGQASEVASKLRKDAANLARAMTDMLDAMARTRGKGGQQVVRVEHIHVHSGARAVVGNIAAGGGGGAQEIPEEPRGAPARLAHDAAIGAVLPALRGADTSGDALSVACDEEPPALPPARWALHGTEDSRRSGADSGRPDDARDAHGRDGEHAPDDARSA